MEHPAYSQLRPVTPNAGVVLCPNPSYGALEGTNSWIIRAEGDPRSIVVDPGPQDEGHLNVLNHHACEIGLILLTHRHPDHADGAARLSQITGASVRSADKHFCKAGGHLVDGEVITVEGVTPAVKAVATPGHTADSVSFFLYPSGEAAHADDGSGAVKPEGIVTGDTIAGKHTTMISETDGDLGQYLATLDMLRQRGAGVPLLPAHGPDHPDLEPFAQKYLDRRYRRLDQIREARQRLGDDISVDQLVDEIYTDVDPVLRGAAQQSTRVALRYLNAQGE
ncbi:MBL fold metallo-hydrolase [Corynebacterium kroppenstedtii]|uniref:MBL fold metallo-hydrolase n=1 Tax=Corynebacterium sp. PCR 32 TaxID=3351342 RepID=UPI0030B415BC